MVELRKNLAAKLGASSEGRLVERWHAQLGEPMERTGSDNYPASR